MILNLNVRCGPQRFVAAVDVRDNSETLTVESESENLVVLKTVGDLRQFIAAKTSTDPAKIKIIHKGKSIGTDYTEPLINYKFADSDSLMIMGMRNCTPAKSVEEDPGFIALNDYEKRNLIRLNETFHKNGKELAELERNFLEGDMAKEMIKRVDKQLQAFTHTSLKHLENIDGLKIFDDSTPEEQKMRNREKRKALINGIQDLLNANDKLIFQLSQHTFRIEHPDESH